MKCGSNVTENGTEISTVFNCYVEIEPIYSKLFYGQIGFTVLLFICLFIKLKCFTPDKDEEIYKAMTQKAREN